MRDREGRFRGLAELADDELLADAEAEKRPPLSGNRLRLEVAAHGQLLAGRSAHEDAPTGTGQRLERVVSACFDAERVRDRVRAVHGAETTLEPDAVSLGLVEVVVGRARPDREAQVADEGLFGKRLEGSRNF